MADASIAGLRGRLAAAGVDSDAAPLCVWAALREIEGRRTTVVDLYELVAAPRGLAAEELPLAERRALARSVMAIIWPGYTTTPGSDRPGDPIVVLDYDPSWPAVFATWRARLAEQLGDAAVRVEHVGSTSVAGMAAKPTIDIQVSVASLADESGYVAHLEAAGVQLRTRDELHRYFRPFPGRPREVNVHVCEVGSDWEQEHLLFRDYLRAHPHARDAYAGAKRAAARRWADDGIAYTEAKSQIILSTLDAAEQWASSVSSSRRAAGDDAAGVINPQDHRSPLS